MSNNNQDSRGKLLPWALAAIVGLVGSNVYLWMSKGEKQTQVETLQVQLTDLSSAKDSLQRTYDAALVELEAMKGKNTELNALIDRQKEEVTKSKNRISELLKSANGYKAAQAEIAKLKDQVNGYMAQIADLNKKNEELGKNVATLTADKTALQQDIQKANASIEQVKTEKTQVEDAKAKVEAERAALKNEVEKGSVVTVDNFGEVQGFAVRESGKEKKKKWAENIQRLKFTFDIAENRIAKPGKETFYFRVIDPTGVAVAVQSGGAGVLKLNDGKEVQYTFAKDVDYNGQAQKAEIVWDPGVALQRGQYKIEVYNKGFQAGTHTIVFKK